MSSNDSDLILTLFSLILSLCGEEKKYSADGSTANLRGHVQHQHKDVWNKRFSTPKKSG